MMYMLVSKLYGSDNAHMCFEHEQNVNLWNASGFAIVCIIDKLQSMQGFVKDLQMWKKTASVGTQM